MSLELLWKFELGTGKMAERLGHAMSAGKTASSCEAGTTTQERRFGCVLRALSTTRGFSCILELIRSAYWIAVIIDHLAEWPLTDWCEGSKIIAPHDSDADDGSVCAALHSWHRYRAVPASARPVRCKTVVAVEFPTSGFARAGRFDLVFPCPLDVSIHVAVSMTDARAARKCCPSAAQMGGGMRIVGNFRRCGSGL